MNARGLLAGFGFAWVGVAWASVIRWVGVTWVGFASLASACDAGPSSDWSWADYVPDGYPTPRVPADNPMSHAKVELGRRLFFDTRLSLNRTQSCATCHDQAHAFAEARPTSVGSTGEAHTRNAMSLTNVAYNATLTWANPLLRQLEQQALVPLLGTQPTELGFAGQEAELVARLAADPDYVRLFSESFPDKRGRIGVDTVVMALAAFQRTLLSFDSPYDRYRRGDEDALSPQARAGLDLFEALDCVQCHGGFNFQGVTASSAGVGELLFVNNGLYDLGGGAYPPADQGLFEVTGDLADRGLFAPPTLRNLRYTAPYMHDGSVATLDEVLDLYARGGRLTSTGPNAGDGRDHPKKSPLVKGFSLTADERQALLAFLHALSDERFVTP